MAPRPLPRSAVVLTVLVAASPADRALDRRNDGFESGMAAAFEGGFCGGGTLCTEPAAPILLAVLVSLLVISSAAPWRRAPEGSSTRS